MLTNYHTHTTFCDGKNTAEDVVLAAIEKGFHAIGFSGHGYTPFDVRYCMRDKDAYIKEIKRLQRLYANQIQIYLGSEEDIFHPVNRDEYAYIISSSHYFCVDGKYLPIDSGFDYFSKCVDAFSGNYLRLADTYYKQFCTYINKRKPDIIGHFDLITKFDEKDSHFFCDEKYCAMADRYMIEAAKSGSLFEVNTGAISRGYRTTPYPSARLLHTLHKIGGNVILCSDSHAAETLDFHFDQAIALLKDAGFTYVYALYNGRFIKDPI